MSPYRIILGCCCRQSKSTQFVLTPSLRGSQTLWSIKSEAVSYFWVKTFLQHLLNISHFHNLLSSRPPLDLIMSVIRRRYNRLQGKVQGHGAALTTISHRPHHMCQTAMFGLGSPRPVAPRSKTIRHILPLLPAVPASATVWPCVAPPAPWPCGHMCGCPSCPRP